MGFGFFGLGKKKKKLTRDQLVITDRSEKLYVGMSSEELLELYNNERVFAVIMRIENIIDKCGDMNEALEQLNDTQRTVYAVYSYEAEVTNGGIMQFFTNSSRAVIPYVSKGLQEIGAAEHKKIFDILISRYEIDTEALATAEGDELDELLEEYGRYPLENFDASYLTIEPMQENIEEYVKANIHQL